MFCAISGEVPQEPVVSRKSGALYEKRLVEKYIREEGRCPVTGEELGEDDLIAVQANKALRPRPIAGTSVPGLLAAFQNEWDELMLETFTLKQHLDTTRQELAQSLYQHDAACRVIARLMVERDEARTALAALSGSAMRSNNNSITSGQNGKQQIGTTAVVEAESTAQQMDVSAEAGTGTDTGTEAGIVGLAAVVVEELVSKCTELSGLRRGRSKAMTAAAAEIKSSLEKLTQTASYTPHKADNKTTVTCVAARSNFSFPDNAAGDASAAATQATAVILSGSSDKNVLLTEQQSGKVLAKLQGHSKPVTAVGFQSAGSSTLISAAADKTVKIWNASTSGGGSRGPALKYTVAWNYTGHASTVSGFTVHPTGNYMVSTAAEDTAWHFLDIVNGACLKVVSDAADADAAVGGYSCCSFHPDGLILGIGAAAANTLGIWDIREMRKVHSLAPAAAAEEGAESKTTATAAAAVKSISFSENGYHAATGSADGWLRLWDLRKLACTKSVRLGDSAVCAVSFDHSGLFVAAAGGGAEQLQIRAVKEWAPTLELNEQHSKAITGLCWSQEAATSTLLSCAADGSIKIYS